MKRILILSFIFAYFVLFVHEAKAESFFHAEVGLGVAISRDMGDGTWYQDGVAQHHEQLSSPGYMAGLTGDIDDGIAWHADYVYFGQQSASCICVPDSAYNAQTHMANEPGYIPFNGFGHIQGFSLTIEPHGMWHGYRIGLEGGAWLSWATWHETRSDPAYPAETHLMHRTQFAASWVAGASISKGRVSLSYRYYRQPQQWNPYPGIVTGTHMVMLKYRF